MGKVIDLSIIIPFYNEQGNVHRVYGALIKSLIGQNITYEVIMVNNGSSDNTEQEIKQIAKKDKHISYIHIIKNKGYGYGVITGLKAANGMYVGYIDGDDAICATFVPAIYAWLLMEKLDLCYGIRIKRGQGLNRKSASKAYNLIFNLFFLSKIDDINGKPKLLRRECFYAMALSSYDWFVDSEIIIKALQHNYRMGYIKVEAEKRKWGYSYVKPATAMEFLRNLLRYRWKLWTSQKL